jgi:hypothetical protein
MATSATMLGFLTRTPAGADIDIDTIATKAISHTLSTRVIEHPL